MLQTGNAGAGRAHASRAKTDTVARLMLHCKLDFERPDLYIRATLRLWAQSCEENS